MLFPFARFCYFFLHQNIQKPHKSRAFLSVLRGQEPRCKTTGAETHLNPKSTNKVPFGICMRCTGFSANSNVICDREY